MQNVEFPEGFFDREDDSSDDGFYSVARKVVHIDERAIAACRDLYARLLPGPGEILDLMSSWRSHLPEQGEGRLIGLGMNAEEMADNPQLAELVVHDLNTDVPLPFAGSRFDGAVCSVSVQYMTRPIETFQDVLRVLKHGAPFVLTFSNRCFPTKAIAAWRGLGDEDHKRLVALYFARSGGWQGVTAETVLEGVPGVSDPLYAVWGYKSAAG